MNPFVRWLRFNAVGLAGAVVQLTVLWAYTHLCRLSYLPATALAVETAVLHNFFWHEVWTWRDRRDLSTRTGRLLRFHLANGLVSLIANLLLMRLLAGVLGLPVLIANALSIAATAVFNFLAGEFWVFARRS